MGFHTYRLPFTCSDDEGEDEDEDGVEDGDGVEDDLVVLPSSSPSAFRDAECEPEFDFDPVELAGSSLGAETPRTLGEPEAHAHFFADERSEKAPSSVSMPANSKRKPAAPAATADPYGPSGHATKAMKALKKAPSECSCLCSAFLSLDVCVTAGRCVSDSGGSSVI